MHSLCRNEIAFPVINCDNKRINAEKVAPQTSRTRSMNCWGSTSLPNCLFLYLEEEEKRMRKDCHNMKDGEHATLNELTKSDFDLSRSLPGGPDQIRLLHRSNTYALRGGEGLNYFIFSSQKWWNPIASAEEFI